MAIDIVHGAPWTRKHDNPSTVLIPQATIAYPKSLSELIELCSTPAYGHLHAAGSHWALSPAALSDTTFIETHDPNLNQFEPVFHQAMGKTLIDVIPGCMTDEYLKKLSIDDSLPYLVHVESGKRIYQLYAELDQGQSADDTTTLAGVLATQYNNNKFFGPYGFNTLGGAGGQTVVGALSTGTHGGDFDRPPVADAVRALHLVVDGGRHYWIEPSVTSHNPALTDDEKLYSVYGGFGADDSFEIIRDDNVFNAVLVSAGRFGVIYSVVLAATPQYELHEMRSLPDWQDVKGKIKDWESDLYFDDDTPMRFLQIAVSLTSYGFFARNLAGVTKRIAVPLSANPAGRAERVGSIVPGHELDPRIQAPLFTNAGASDAYDGDGSSPSFLNIACADKSFLKGVLTATIEEVENFVNSHGVEVGATIAAIAVAGAGGLLLLFAELLAVVVELRVLLAAIDDDTRFGQFMNNIKNALLKDTPDPASHAAGIFVWQMVYYLSFKGKQGDLDMTAISYAVMDRHDYLAKMCEVNVDSVEVFFDASEKDVSQGSVVAYVDKLIDFEKRQEYEGKAAIGYASLRFMQNSRALLGMQRWDRTVSVEVSCLRDVSGGQDLVSYATWLARQPAFNGFLHWGQRNDCTQAEIEARYDDTVEAPGGPLGTWRQALARLTDNGRLDAFSNAFTRQTGLEVVQPAVAKVWSDETSAHFHDPVTVRWQASSNPPGTTLQLTVSLIVAQNAGGDTLQLLTTITALPLDGSYTYTITTAQSHRFTVQSSYTLNNETRVADLSCDIAVS